MTTGAAAFPYPDDDPATIRGLGTTLQGASTSLDGILGDVTAGRGTIEARWLGQAGPLAVAEVDAVSRLGEQGVTALADAQAPLDDYATALDTARDSIDLLRTPYDNAQQAYDDEVARLDAGDDVTAAERADALEQAASTRDRQVAELQGQYDDVLETLRAKATAAGAALAEIGGRISPAPHSRDGALAAARALDILPFMSRRNGLTVTRVGDRIIVDTGNGDEHVQVRIDPATGDLIVTIGGRQHRVPRAGGANLVIRTNGGNDVIDVDPTMRVGFNLLSGEGNDLVAGAGGNDVIYTGGGNDDVVGGLGNDAIGTGGGNDNVYGGAFVPTTLLARRHARTLGGRRFNGRQDGGDDTIGTGAGSDTVGVAPGGNHHIEGGTGNDRLSGGSGADIIRGGAGNDIIHAGGGDDTVHGGTGDDTVHAGGGNDTVHGGEGADRLHGEAGDDRLGGDAGNDRLRGGAGQDRIWGSGGNDTIHGDAGNDFIDSGHGVNTIYGGDGNDTIIGGRTAETRPVGDSRQVFGDLIHGGAGNDTIDAGGGFNEVYGGDGTDTITGRNGDNEFYGGAGNDTIYGDNADDYIDGGAGNDLIRGGDGDDVIYAGRGHDQAYGGEGNDYIDGFRGNDFVYGGAGNDIVSGGRGHDILRAGEGNDVIYTGHGRDTVNDTQGANKVYHQEEDRLAVNRATNHVIVEIVDVPHQITIEGSPEFRDRVLADLETMAASPTGQKLLETLGNTLERPLAPDYDLVIREYDTNNGQAQEGFNKITVHLNPEHRMPDGVPISLTHHELIHGYHYSTGQEVEDRILGPGSDWYLGPDPRQGPSGVTLDTNNDGKLSSDEIDRNDNGVIDQDDLDLNNDGKVTKDGDGWTPNVERQTVGLPVDHDGNPDTPAIPADDIQRHPPALTENALRREMGLPGRETY